MDESSCAAIKFRLIRLIYVWESIYFINGGTDGCL